MISDNFQNSSWRTSRSKKDFLLCEIHNEFTEASLQIITLMMSIRTHSEENLVPQIWFSSFFEDESQEWSLGPYENFKNVCHARSQTYWIFREFKASHVDNRKIWSKKDTSMIFFPVKAEMLLFSNLELRGPPGGPGLRYFDLKFLLFWLFSKNIKLFQTKRAKLRAPELWIWKKQHLSLHWKKLWLYLF